VQGIPLHNLFETHGLKHHAEACEIPAWGLHEHAILTNETSKHTLAIHHLPVGITMSFATDVQRQIVSLPLIQKAAEMPFLKSSVTPYCDCQGIPISRTNLRLLSFPGGLCEGDPWIPLQFYIQTAFEAQSLVL